MNVETLRILYNQVKSYEDRMWIGFLIAREQRKSKTDFRNYLENCAEKVKTWPDWKQECLK